MRAVDISVVVTNYNYGRYLRRCVRSLLNQDLDRHLYEIIVVDDKSTDDSLVALEPFRSAGEIRVIVNERNLGVGASARAGVDHSRAKFFVRVDADDYVQPAFLYMLYTFLRLNQDYIGVSCDYFLTTEDEKILSTESFQDNGIACGLMLRTSYLEKVGSYDPVARIFEDQDLMSRIDMKRVYHLPVPLYNYVKHGNSLTDGVRLGTGAV
ncbi:MAG: glycosyltransferase family 2 protein [Alphaproteobacteria bacterium]|nr:glycosyltransferase family 2 protein [Alphaproteobacteria bacterium]